MTSRLERPARLEDSATIDEPPDGPIARRCRGPQGDRGVTSVHAGRDLVAVASARRDDLELGPADPRRRFIGRRFTSRRLICRRFTRRRLTILLRPLHILGRPRHYPALMPVA